MPFLEEMYDIVVVGAGHAGCEAALAGARLGLETIMFTVSVDSPVAGFDTLNDTLAPRILVPDSRE